jgi:glucan phosphoethanolaminetransferase (alkaline phosphatase superfamily)
MIKLNEPIIVILCSAIFVLLCTFPGLIALIKGNANDAENDLGGWIKYILFFVFGTLFIAGVYEGVIDPSRFFGPGQ